MSIDQFLRHLPIFLFEPHHYTLDYHGFILCCLIFISLFCDVCTVANGAFQTHLLPCGLLGPVCMGWKTIYGLKCRTLYALSRVLICCLCTKQRGNKNQITPKWCINNWLRYICIILLLNEWRSKDHVHTSSPIESWRAALRPSETHIKSKSRKTSFTHNLITRYSVVLKFCTEHGSTTAMLYAKVRNDCTTETVKDEHDFTRIEFKMILGRIPYIAQPPVSCSFCLHYVDDVKIDCAMHYGIRHLWCDHVRSDF